MIGRVVEGWQLWAFVFSVFVTLLVVVVDAAGFQKGWRIALDVFGTAVFFWLVLVNRTTRSICSRLFEWLILRERLLHNGRDQEDSQ